MVSADRARAREARNMITCICAESTLATTVV